MQRGPLAHGAEARGSLKLTRDASQQVDACGSQAGEHAERHGTALPHVKGENAAAYGSRPCFSRSRVEERHGQGSRASTRYSITWSARTSTDGGILRPSAFAVLALTTSSNLVGSSTRRSAGFAPLRILST